MSITSKKLHGFSLVEVIIVAALSTLIFGVLFTSFQFSIQLLQNSRAKLSALSIANDRMEFLRSLPYSQVGTLGGIPAGLIPQNSTTTLNGIVFSERILIEYVDDPADGQDTATTSDSNGIPSDYKRVKVEYTWTIASTTDRLSLISNIVPRSIETTDGGGTIRVAVVDENNTILPGASVRLVNNTLSPRIDVTRLSNAQGVALFSGAPAGSNYEVFVTRNGYSSDQTYIATTSNPLPVLAPFSVLESDVSSVTFRIDELSDLDVFVYSNLTEGVWEETFSASSSVVSTAQAEVSGGGLVLTNTLGSFASSGTAFLAAVTPTPLLQWDTLRVDASFPSGTSALIRFYTDDGTGTYTLIPDSELQGNALGFTDSLIDLRGLDAVVYPSLVIGVSLATTQPTNTPRINELAVFYREASTELSGLSTSLRGDTNIGTETDLTPIYKTTRTSTTNGVGRARFEDIEFDSYTLSFPASYSIATACPANPYYLTAGVSDDIYFVLAPPVTHAMRVVVRDSLGRPIPGAEVAVTRSGLSEDLDTNNCGQAFFAGLPPENDYRVEVSAPGYINTVSNGVVVSGNREVIMILND